MYAKVTVVNTAMNHDNKYDFLFLKYKIIDFKNHSYMLLRALIGATQGIGRVIIKSYKAF